jgi:small subunit ribosomal protein S21
VIPIAYVTIEGDEELERAIKRFKRQVEKEGIIREWKKREFYEKPSTLKSRRKKAMKRKQIKKQRRGGNGTKMV